MQFEPKIDSESLSHSSLFRYLAWPYTLLQNLNRHVFLLLILTIAFLKNGIRGIQPWPDFSYVQQFPTLKDNFSTLSIGWLAIAKTLSIDDQASYFILTCLSLLIMCIGLFFWIEKHLSDEKLLWFRLWFFLGFPLSILMGNIGRHDFFSLFGVVFMYFCKSRFARYIALTFALLGSPEHVFLSLLLSLPLVYFFERTKLRDFLFLTASSFLVLVILHIWAFKSDVSSNRLIEFLDNPAYMRTGIGNWIKTFPLEWFGYFGIFWFVIYLYALMEKNRVRLILTLLAFLFPMLGTILLLDKTRDYILFTILPFMIVTQWVIQQLQSFPVLLSDEIQKVLKGVIVLLILCLPNIEATFEGSIRSPFAWILKKLGDIGILLV